jgi:hypothetical protein
MTTGGLQYTWMNLTCRKKFDENINKMVQKVYILVE